MWKFAFSAVLLALGMVVSAPSYADTGPGAPPTGSPPAGVTQDASGNSLSPFHTEVGHIQLSLDAVGTNEISGTVQVDKPEGATVRKAYLFAASTGWSDYQPDDQSVTLDDQAVAWDPSTLMANSISSYNVAGDVTTLVQDKLNNAAPGVVDFTVAEQSSMSMDGEVLAVIWSVPQATVRTVALFYGAQSTMGDSFSVNLGQPLKKSSTATMSLGISYGYQVPDSGGQRSEIDIDGTRLTSSAGGQDDGFPWNGALITVGGIGDSPDNPAEPMSTGCGQEPRCDDELYDLKSVLPADATSFTVDTANPSNDDNIFLAAFDISAVEANFGESVTVTPGDARQEVGTSHLVRARAQDANGDPVTAPVSFEIVEGPNKGLPLTAIQLPDGRWVTSWISQKQGTDEVQASFEGSSGTVTSNIARQEWAAAVNGTFGGLWPFSGDDLTLNYAYPSGKYSAEVDEAARRWNDTPTKVDLAKWQFAPQAIHLPMVDVNVSDTYWAMTVFASDCLECGYTANGVHFNTRTLDSASLAQRQKVATHELGHALGLRHPRDFGVDAKVPSLMWQGNLSDSVKGTPQPLDTDRVNGMYP